MHSLLRRQFRRHAIDAETVPSPWADLLRDVDEAYEASDADRRMLERSLELDSHELTEANSELSWAGELLRRTLESTAEGILAIGSDRRVLHMNRRLAELWQLPEDLRAPGDAFRLLAHATERVADPERFLGLVGELAGTDAEQLNSFALRDGREFECYSLPLRGAAAVSGRVWSFRDVTAQVRAQAALRESEQRFRAIVQNSSDMIVIVDANAVPTYVSPSVERVMGHSEAAWRGRSMMEFLHPDDVPQGAASFAGVVAEPGVHPVTELRVRHRDGSWRYVEMVANNMLDVPGVAGIVFNARDVTERRSAERGIRASEERLRRIAESTPVGIYQMDVGRRLTYLNPSACAMLEVRDQEEANRCGYHTFFGEESRAVLRSEHARRAAGESSTYEVELRGLRGARRHVLISGAVLRADDEQPAGVIGTIIDITDRKRQEEQLRHAASHDPLTNVFNRRRFQQEVQRELAALDHEARGSSAVLFLDLDDFKAVNDSYGHPVGDKLLVRVTQALRAELREGDVLARLGGDEFAVLLRGVDVREARARSTALLRSLGRRTMEVEGRLIETLGSIGIAMMPAHGRSVDELLAHADVAMYEAKARGRNRVAAYSTRGRAAAGEARLKWKHRIREALDHGRLALYGQPIVDLRTGAVDRYELLLRMQGEDGRIVMPSSFLGIAETSGLIAEIDAWVVREAIRLLRDHGRSGGRLRVAVNLSARALEDRGLAGVIRRELAAASVDPGSICFEVTESAAIANVENAQRLITGLSATGCEFSLDDFGVGFSSFSRLKHLRLHELKIDGGFVQNLKDSPVDQHLVRAIVELARGLGMRVVAEFVQDEESLRLLREYGVEYGQGYYWGPAVPFEAIDAARALRAA